MYPDDREYIIDLIREFNSNDHVMTSSVSTYARQLTRLITPLSTYQFGYFGTNTRIKICNRNGPLVTYSKDELPKLNRQVQLRLRFYEVPYCLNFYHDEYTYRVDIRELTVLDHTDDLVEALFI